MIGNVIGGGRYQIGEFYLSSSSTSPAILFGGTWEQIKDKFLLAAGDMFTAGSIGGEATHTLTIDEMPSHNHELYGALTAKQEQIANSGNNWAQTTTAWSKNNYIKNTGGGEAHNNMPPYLTIYIWRRIA